MRSNPAAERRNATIFVLLMLSMLTMAWGGGEAREIPTAASSQPGCPECLVIQGRITAIEGAFVTVKTPDGFPGGPGVHAQFVKAGPTMRADVSHAQVLLPDGTQPDTRPLAVGDRVLMVLNGPPAAVAPDAAAHVYRACVLERVVESDKIVTH
jgi:hypothetical protein